jgi:hypothetical protein
MLPRCRLNRPCLRGVAQPSGVAGSACIPDGADRRRQVETRPAAGVDDQGGRVPGAAQHPLAGLGIDHQVRDRGDLLVGFSGAEQPIEAAEDGGWARIGEREGPQRVADPPHRGRRGQSFAHDIAYRHGEPAIRQLEGVIPVAAHFSVRRPVCRRGNKAGGFREHGRQEAP